MNRRLQLHDMLLGIMSEAYLRESQSDKDVRDFSGNVYFQPPSSVLMSYPAIVYQRSRIDTRFADDGPYVHHERFGVTVIDADPDSIIPMLIAGLPKCRFERSFISDNLYHNVFELYY